MNVIACLPNLLRCHTPGEVGQSIIITPERVCDTRDGRYGANASSALDQVTEFCWTGQTLECVLPGQGAITHGSAAHLLAFPGKAGAYDQTPAATATMRHPAPMALGRVLDDIDHVCQSHDVSWLAWALVVRMRIPADRRDAEVDEPATSPPRPLP